MDTESCKALGNSLEINPILVYPKTAFEALTFNRTFNRIGNGLPECDKTSGEDLVPLRTFTVVNSDFKVFLKPNNNAVIGIVKKCKGQFFKTNYCFDHGFKNGKFDSTVALVCANPQDVCQRYCCANGYHYTANQTCELHELDLENQDSIGRVSH